MYAVTEAGYQMLRLRGLRLAHLWHLQRRDGYSLRLTSHDRALTAFGELYEPAVLADVSSDRKESGMKESAVEVASLIDGDLITIPDLRGRLYQGATVHHHIVDVRQPWVILRADKYWISRIEEDGMVFKGLLETQVAQLQQSIGGWAGSTFTTKCQKTLGSVKCGANISAHVYTGVTVLTVVSGFSRSRFAMDPGTWPAGSPARDDDYYREGVIEWTSGANVLQKRQVIKYGHADRSIELLLPTPFPIQIGDEATVKPGCDGLLITCDTKYANAINHGGSPYDPGADKVVTPQTRQA